MSNTDCDRVRLNINTLKNSANERATLDSYREKLTISRSKKCRFAGCSLS